MSTPEATAKDTQMITLTIDGQQITVPKGTTVFTAAQQLGINIPVFCYQDRMPPFGACRVCLVEVEKMNKLQTSCTLEATEGMVVQTQSKMAEDGRKGILEFLLINHPLDCPICDRGGECPLQDQALQYGPGLSRFFEKKRVFEKAIPLGPVLMLDRERCIVCARCTRFGDLIAGDHALEMIDRGYKTEIGTPNGGPAESKFIGNTIMICPVGALTSDVYRFRARPWDNDSTQSACTLCPVGCSMILDSRDGEIMRTRSCENKEINDIWLCDKGWFGYEYTDHIDRLEHPLIRKKGMLEKATWNEALELIANKIREMRPGGKLAGWGGNPLTTEENFLFQKLMRNIAGVNHVDHRIGMPLLTVEEEVLKPGMVMSIGETEELSYAILLGLDLTEEFPVIWLRLKQAINKGAKVIFIGHYAPEISKHLFKTILHTPGKAVETIQANHELIREIAGNGSKGALFVGRQYLNNPNRKVILSEIVKLRESLPSVKINIMEGSGNSVGARFAGMRPDMGPLETPLPQPGLNILQVMEEASKSGWDFLYVAGANPALKYPSKIWQEARDNLKFLVVQDLFLTETALSADVVLPTLSYVEKEGSFLNIAGNRQTLLPGKKIPENLYSDGVIFTKIGEKFDIELTLENQFLDALRHVQFKTDYRQLALSNELKELIGDGLKASFVPALFDHGVRMKHNPHAIWLAKEPFAHIHPKDAEKRNLKDGAVVQISSHKGFLSGRVKLNSGIAEGTILLPLGFEELPVRELGPELFNGMEIRIE